MTSRVFSVRPDDSLAALRELMDDKRIRHVPVVDEDGSLVGLVTERDLLRRASTADADVPLSLEADIFDAVRVGDITTWEVETVEADDDIASAAQAMLDNKYGCMPVVDGGALAGILTEADFVRFVAASGDLQEQPATARRRRH